MLRCLCRYSTVRLESITPVLSGLVRVSLDHDPDTHAHTSTLQPQQHNHSRHEGSLDSGGGEEEEEEAAVDGMLQQQQQWQGQGGSGGGGGSSSSSSSSSGRSSGSICDAVFSDAPLLRMEAGNRWLFSHQVR